MATNGTKWRQNDDKIAIKWRKNGEKMAANGKMANGDKNGVKMATKWSQNGDKMAIKWR